MSAYNGVLLKLAVRIVISLPLLITGIYWAARSDEFDFIVGLLLMMIAAIIVGPTLAGLLAESSGSLFFPTETDGIPPPMYSIPQGKAKNGLYEEAMAGYEEIARRYPHEMKPYLDMIEIAITRLHDPDRAERIYREGLARLPKEEDQLILTRMYAAVSTRLEILPEWLKKEQEKEIKPKERSRKEYPNRSGTDFSGSI